MISNQIKQLNIYDIPCDYDYDVINCFEHPIAAILNYFDRRYTNHYLALAKFRGVYTQGNVRKLVLRETESLFGISVRETGRLSYKLLMKSVDEQAPLLAGVNLKQLFYSEHYKNKNWGHWLLVKGYDRNRDLTAVLDNTQLEQSGHGYETFPLPYEILKTANDDYKKVFGKEYAGFLFRKEREINPVHVLKHLLAEYESLDLSGTNNYKQMELLAAFRNLINEENKNIDIDYYGNELKKKLINVNKYRKLFQTEMEGFMVQYGFEPEKIAEFKTGSMELNNLWELFLLRKIAESARGRYLDLETDLLIIEKERQIQRLLNQFRRHMDNAVSDDGNYRASDGIQNKESADLSYPAEHNEDGIITEHDSGLVFHFQGKKTCNWWDTDEAPKILLSVLQGTQTFEVRTVITVDREQNAKNYEAGIFIRNPNTGESLILGLENEENIVLDEIGVTGHKLYVGKMEEYSLFLRDRAGRLEGGLCLYGTDQVLFTSEYGTLGEQETGLVCKTWGTGGNLKVTFRNISYDIG